MGNEHNQKAIILQQMGNDYNEGKEKSEKDSVRISNTHQ
jgi:hypothetical protein